MVSEALFIALVALVAIQRIAEMIYSKRNVARMLHRGGREHAPEQMKWMTLLHIGWLAGMCLEVLVLDRPFVWPLAIVALVVFAAGQLLRYAAMRALGDHWNVRIVTMPGEHVVTGGIYRYVRHPNYLGVTLELAALPLVHGAWITAIVATALNALMLKARIDAEEAALGYDTDYQQALSDRPRMVPVLQRRREAH